MGAVNLDLLQKRFIIQSEQLLIPLIRIIPADHDVRIGLWNILVFVSKQNKGGFCFRQICVFAHILLGDRFPTTGILEREALFLVGIGFAEGNLPYLRGRRFR